VQYISEFTDAPTAFSSDVDDDNDAAAAAVAARSGEVLEALPGQADPATKGGPVALPAAGAVMRGRREYTALDRDEERRTREAERSRITMNQASAAPPGGGGGAGRGAGGAAESRQDRLKRLMAAQFNSNVAKDTKRTLDRRMKEEGDRRAQEALERHAAAMARRDALRTAGQYDSLTSPGASLLDRKRPRCLHTPACAACFPSGAQLFKVLGVRCCGRAVSRSTLIST
jgi:hypothetical protein